MKKNSEKKTNKFLQLIYSTNIPKIALTLGLVGSLITTVVSLSIPLLTRELIDGFSVESINWILIGIIFLVFMLQAILEGTSLYALTYVGQRIVASLREKMWLKLVRLPVSYFDKTKSGETVSRVVNDTGIVKDLISQQFPQFFGGVVTVVGAVSVLLVMDWRMTVLMLIAVPFTALFIMPLGHRMSKISRSLQDETAHFTGLVQQTLSEIRLMKASNAETTEEKKGILGINNLLSLGMKEGRIFALIAPIIYLVIMVVIVFIIGYGGIRVTQGSMTTGTLVAFLLYLFQIIFPITSFAIFFTQLQKAQGASERITEILNVEEESSDGDKELDVSNQPIHIDNVSFFYNEENPVLRKMSFNVTPGTVVALAGPSGSGKTTMFGLLEQFYRPTKGEIYIGKISIKELSIYSWRRQIGYVSQDSPMVLGSIRENLCYGLEDQKDIDDERLWEVAKMAFADQFISDFPKGLDTEVGERGVKLSGGQRQRIAIARAILRNPKILMMDEATVSLDSQSEGMVQQALTKLMQGRTTFLIAHRLSTIINADKIIFIEDGHITGEGTHDELVKTHNLYKEFAEQQLS
ncbi:ABC transporter ATP-binding protein [Lentibacillus sp. CBA3610]|uniref:ABC transporter ATP-binding protein n=1 Tax=Lentibacillus sp. CBA3610 TaxID=2518176 RepID=UPI00159577F9|nr:ABC transporter ATP-binding protein [Lentibacillus sp. CBA3610]QKY71281.1 ABC transporter ATP-binding protein [Lentibacillus sp. CBA3610]